nr:MAG TPA: tail completion protein [Caudoviricetes sp.]
MNSRLELHEVLCSVLGSRNAYFQPPASIKMKYPAIVYKRDTIVNSQANNEVYKQANKYQLIVIDQNPDSEIVQKISKLSRIRYDRHYVSDGLNHDVFTIFY